MQQSEAKAILDVRSGTIAESSRQALEFVNKALELLPLHGQASVNARLELVRAQIRLESVISDAARIREAYNHV